MRHYYHLTPAHLLPQILGDRQGLMPELGPRSQEAFEPHAAVFLFTSAEAVTDAMRGWAGLAFEDTEKLALLVVRAQPHFLPTPGADFEARSFVPVPVDDLAVLAEDVLDLTDSQLLEIMIEALGDSPFEASQRRPYWCGDIAHPATEPTMG